MRDIVTVLNAPLRRGGNTSARISESPGGIAANAAWMARLAGAQVRFVGHAGADEAGERQLRELTDAGIEARLVHRGTTTTIVVIVDPDAERSFAVDAASSLLRPTEIAAADFADCGIVHLQAEESPVRGSLASLVAQHALAQEAALSVDLASAAAATAPATQSLLAMEPAVVFANDDEFVAAWPTGRPSVEGLVVHKRGSRPTRLWYGGTCQEVPVDPVEDVIDTTGAGDCFAGTFLAAWAHGLDAVPAVTLGHRAAAQVITRPGARLRAIELPPGLPLGRPERA